MDRISKGDIPAKITDNYNGDFNEIKNNLNACIDVMNGLLAETDTLIQATLDGKLADARQRGGFAGGWGKLVGGVNKLIDAFVAADQRDGRVRGPDLARATSRRRSPTTTTATSTRSRTT